MYGTEEDRLLKVGTEQGRPFQVGTAEEGLLKVCVVELAAPKINVSQVE